jgi:hypothetical protein
MRGFHDWIAMAGKVAISLVVSDYNDDIGGICGYYWKGQKGSNRKSDDD